MEIKKQKLFRWDSILFGDWLWAVMILFPTAVVAKVLHYNYVVTKEGLDIGALITLAVVLLCFWAITFRRYQIRYRFIKSIAFYTRQGVAVAYHDAEARRKTEALAPEGVLVTSFSKTFADAIRHWTWWAQTDTGIAMYPHLASCDLTRPNKWLNGAVMIIVPKKFKVPSYDFFLMGVARGNRSVIANDETRIKDLDDLLRLAKHEKGHVVMDALGIPAGPNAADIHHKLMADTKFGA